MENQNKEKRFTRLPLSAYLLYIIVATLLFTGVTFSGYISVAGGSGSARVAKFEIKEIVNGSELAYEETIRLQGTASPNSPMTQKIKVENKSEVSVEYTMELVNVTDNMPLEISMKRDDEQVEDTDGDALSVTDKLSYKGGGTDTADYTLEITLNTTDPKYMGMVDLIEVTLVAAQCD